ncbi:MAG TPA: SpoIIE family protein phosphatase [Rubrobacteraceae bacterium]|nr:SpoIIE family protein phosphatase [Rubrobacteraceae bacterium]
MEHFSKFRGSSSRTPDDFAPLLERAVDASSNGILITDPERPDNPIIYVNPAFEKITGYPSEEVLGRNCRFLQGEDTSQAALDEVRAAIREGRDCRVVLKNYRKDGAPFWNELYISPVYDEEGRLVNFVGIQNDITREHRSEEALHESEERLRLAMRAGRIGMCEWNAGTGELVCSEGFAEIFGLAAGRRNPTYRELIENVHPEDREFLRNAQEAATWDEDSYEAEYRVVHPDGGTRWVVERGRTYRDARGRLERTIWVIQDITERKEAEAERDRLLERERQAREWAEEATRRMFVLEETSSVLSASLDYETTLRRIPNIFVPSLADWCLVDVLDEDGTLIRTAQAHADPERDHLLQEMESQSHSTATVPEVSQALDTGRSFLGPDVGKAALEERLAAPSQLEARSYMVAPLVARGRVLGTVTLVSSDPDRRYESEDLSLAGELANRCGLALEGARLYREQSYVARTLQRGLLLQDLPEIPGVEVGFEYLPVGEESEVGGDFYDLIDTPYDGWLCLLGDVSGKGARAATTTALILYALRAVASQGDKPSMILSALNEAMLRQDSGNHFCTAVCARLEPEKCEGRSVRLTLARGGHPPPLLLRSGSLEELGEPGRAIGVFGELEIEDLVVRLDAGDALVLYTDGVTEARSPDGTFFGEERLRELVQSCARLDAATVAGCMKDAVLEHQGGSPSDDLAILVLRVSDA